MKRPTSRRKNKSQPKRKIRLDPSQGLVALPLAVGKTVAELNVSNRYDDNGIDIFFDDQSGISFSFEMGLTLTVAQTDGKRDKWREVKRWSRVRPGVNEGTGY